MDSSANSGSHLATPALQRDTTDKWWHLAFGGLMAVSLTLFTLWSLNYVDQSARTLVLIAAVLLGLFMAFNIGGNDVANSFGTSVGAGTLTIKQALLIAAVFEVSGAVIAGGSVTDTVRSGIVDLGAIDLDPMQFVYIMMAALLGAAIWLLVATKMGWPVSTTHSIIGGIVGAALTIGFTTGTGGMDMVQWSKIGQIAISWVLSPLLGGLFAWVLFGFIKKYILGYNEKVDAAMLEIKKHQEEERAAHTPHDGFQRITDLQQDAYSNAMLRKKKFKLKKLDPEAPESEYYRQVHKLDQKAKRADSHRALEVYVPILAAFGAALIAAMLLFKGLDNLELGISTMGNVMIMVMVAAIAWVSVSVFARSLQKQELSRATFTIFAWLQVFTAAAFAFSHGANDIANAIGPFVAILDVLKTGAIGDEAVVPMPALVAFGIALIVGLWFVGRNVIATVGHGLTKMHPSSGFAAELAAAGVVMAASVLGLPVSSTHILIGAVLGVGIVNRSANWKLMRPIALAWIITLPISAAIGSVGVLAISAIF
ncbi:inorganic phosphate transporter [Rothia nasimurium]|uniref:inorganic phosphate transporter n=1 Tax=Rothia nasimurium TaxID=85336 RepID=UPI001F1D35EB|nr:inorganic phosphate transporter [Rothia nasimurium]